MTPMRTEVIIRATRTQNVLGASPATAVYVLLPCETGPPWLLCVAPSPHMAVGMPAALFLPAPLPWAAHDLFWVAQRSLALQA